MMSYSILLIPPNDLLRHPIPNRLFHIWKRLSNKYRILLLSYPNHPLSRKEKVRSMNATEILFRPLLKSKNLGIYYLANYIQFKDILSNVIKKGEIDAVVHANILPSYIATKISAKELVPSVYDYLDHFPESASAYFNSKLASVTSESVVRKIVQSALLGSSKVITVSYTFQSLISQIIKNKNKIKIIPNGVDSEYFRPLPTSRARKIVGLPDDDFILLYYGSIDKWINLDLLFKVISSLKKRIANIRLVLIGSSHNLSIAKWIKYLSLRYGISEKVSMLPPQPYEKISLYINSADAVIAPYRRIIKNFTTPLKIIETIACGRPVITTNILEFKLWFDRVPIFYYDDLADIKKIVIELRKSYDVYHSSFKKYSDIIRRKFSWDRISEIYDEVVREAIEGAG